jgi:hypothetical protein
MIKEFSGLISNDEELSHVTDIEDACGASNGCVLGEI